MSNLRIKDLALNQRPYEKALQFGIEMLSDSELLGLVLRCGTREISSLDLAQSILNAHPVNKGLVGLNYLSLEDLLKIRGVGKVKAFQLLAIAEISKRISRDKFKTGISFNNPSSIADYFMESLRYLTKERIYALMFNSANLLIGEVIISEGTVNKAIISPRELFLEALRHDAAGVVLLHNHPSGNPEPSASDIASTRNIRESGIMLGICLLDHIIVGDKCYVSMLERGLI